MAITQLLWCLRKLSHLVACALDPDDFISFTPWSCQLLSGFTQCVVLAQLLLLLLVPAERLYTVNGFGARNPPSRLTITFYVLGIYALSLAPIVRVLRSDDKNPNNENDPSKTLKNVTFHSGPSAPVPDIVPLCLSMKASPVANLMLSTIQTLIPLGSFVIAFRVRHGGRQIYRSYVDRKAKLTVDERLEVEGVIRAARTVSAISIITCVVFPYNFLLRLASTYLICSSKRKELGGDSKMPDVDLDMDTCMSITYALGYSVGRCATTAGLCAVLAAKVTRCLRYPTSGSFCLQKVKMGSKVIPVTSIADVHEAEEANARKEAALRFKQLQSQWGTTN